MCEQWRLHCTSQWGRETPLREHVYCVAITFKMTEWVGQQICIKFCIELEHSSVETIQVIQRPQQWATGDWQLHHNNTPVHASRLMQCYLAKHQITQVTQPLLPRCGALWHLAFPTTKITFEREEWFQTFSEIQEYMMGQLGSTWRGRWRLGELCEVPRCLLWRGLRCLCPVYNVSCILCLLQ